MHILEVRNEDHKQVRNKLAKMANKLVFLSINCLLGFGVNPHSFIVEEYLSRMLPEQESLGHVSLQTHLKLLKGLELGKVEHLHHPFLEQRNQVSS